MAQLRQDYQEFARRGAEVLAVCPDSVRAVQEYWEREQLPIVGLADPQHTVADLYLQEVNPRKLGRLPALLVIDQAGKVRSQRYGNAMQDIVPNEQVWAILDRLNAEVA